MGSWGFKNFENDDAADFIFRVEEEGITRIYQAILAITDLPETEYLDASESAEALAAIEYVAAAKGNAHPDFPEEANNWIKEKYVADILETRPGDPHTPNIDITAISLSAIERIKTNSELQELWEETEEKEEWIKELENLKKRIS